MFKCICPILAATAIHFAPLSRFIYCLPFSIEVCTKIGPSGLLQLRLRFLYE